MRNECYGCEKQHMGCRADHEARDVLSDGYASRTRKARRLDYKDTRRWRGT